MQRILSRCNALAAQKAGALTQPILRTMSTANHGDGATKEQTVFAEESTSLLMNKYMVYQLCRFPFFVKNARKLTEISGKIFGNRSAC